MVYIGEYVTIHNNDNLAAFSLCNTSLVIGASSSNTFPDNANDFTCYSGNYALQQQCDLLTLTTPRCCGSFSRHAGMRTNRC